MSNIKVIREAKPTRINQGDYFFKESLDSTHVVIITGYRDGYYAIDLEDGIEWFVNGYSTLSELENRLVDDGFKKLPVGSVIEVGVGL